MLHELNSIPDGLLDCAANELHDRLAGPTLIHLAGARSNPLLVSVLMHGNEDVGWEAVRILLKKYIPGGGKLNLPRSLSLFIGNTEAAKSGIRRLAGQPDYNRVWPGTEQEYTAEQAMMEHIYKTMADKQVFASVDIHNNTGLNPHYACINVIKTETLQLAALFSRTVVYFIRPKGVQSLAMSTLCPAVTLECGKVGQAHGTEHAIEYLDACLHLAEHPQHPISPHDIDLFHTQAIVKIPSQISFGFGCDNRDLCLLDDLELLNFRELPPGTEFGQMTKGIHTLDVQNEQGEQVAERYFTLEQGALKTRLPVMPSMLTRNESVIRQDCLCYLMERYDAHLVDAG